MKFNSEKSSVQGQQSASRDSKVTIHDNSMGQ